jgi:hypothetical protein
LSSILKALKKLENQAADQNRFRFWRPQNHMFKDNHEQISSRLHIQKHHVIILAGFVLAFGAGLALNQKLHKRKSKLVAKKEVLHRESVHPLPKKGSLSDTKPFPRKYARFPEQKRATPNNSALPQKSAPLLEKKAVKADRVQKKLTSQMNVTKFKSIGKTAKTPSLSAHKSQKNTDVTFNKKASPLKQVQNKTVVGKPNERPRQKTKLDRFASLPVKRSNQSKIEIQAIAWSSDPRGRLAVINGFILRERESIDNATVMHIGKDSVIFKKQGEEWKQMFGF